VTGDALGNPGAQGEHDHERHEDSAEDRELVILEASPKDLPGRSRYYSGAAFGSFSAHANGRGPRT
jgi:hypothetical protein